VYTEEKVRRNLAPKITVTTASSQCSEFRHWLKVRSPLSAESGSFRDQGGFPEKVVVLCLRTADEVQRAIVSFGMSSEALGNKRRVRIPDVSNACDPHSENTSGADAYLGLLEEDVQEE
jgi:hypothetical protein